MSRDRQRNVSFVSALCLALAALVAGCAPTASPSVSRSSPGGSYSASIASAATGTPRQETPGPFTPAPQASDFVTAFFYVWYGTAAHDGAWRHWNQLDHHPPGDIASSFYPARGPYSSRDPAILTAQMTELKDAGVGVIAVSWWGQSSWDDLTLDAVFDAAARTGIRVAFHIEPYQGRTPESIRADIHALLTRYGDSPALFRIARATSASASTSERAVFYIFASNQLPDSDLRTVLTSIRGTADDSIVLLHSPRARTATRDGADGVYTYDPLISDPSEFAALVSDCRDANLLCSPSVSPGFDDTHAVTNGQSIDRSYGARYDALWQQAIAAHAEWVSIVSYNEWHEGTEIEAAQPYSSGARQYLSFDGAYGLTGTAAEYGYLARTAYWVTAFENAS